MNDQAYDVVVVGAGFGGTACAGILAKRGFNVLCLDANSHAGGKAFTHEVHGHKVDMFTHLLSMGGRGRIAEALKLAGCNVAIHARPEAKWHQRHSPGVEFLEPPTACLFVYTDDGGKRRELRVRRSLSLANKLRMVRWLGIPPRKYPAAYKFMRMLVQMPDWQVDRLSAVPLAEWLQSLGVAPSLYDMASLWCGLMFVHPARFASAGEWIRHFRAIMSTMAAGYATGGCGSVPNAFCSVVEERGGNVSLRTRVERIIVEGGRAVGVTCADGTEYRARAVVSNAGIQATVLGLLEQPDEHLSHEFLARVKELVPSFGGIRVRYFLNDVVIPREIPATLVYDTSIREIDHLTWDEVQQVGSFSNLFSAVGTNGGAASKVVERFTQIPVVTTIPSNFDPSMSPKGTQALVCTAIAPPNPNLDEGVYGRLASLVDENVYSTFPEVEAAVVHRDVAGPPAIAAVSGRTAAGLPDVGAEAVGLAQIPSQVGLKKPDPALPIPGLFLVGCDAGGSGVGLEQAADSAINVSRLVESFLWHVFLKKG
ncbi:MAG: hypothetical protein Kow0069_35090 [Promethearchaeota archaeon]